MSFRREKRADPKPSFVWQGILILAPVLLLAGIGAYTLAKDQRLALREAEARAQELAEAALAAVSDALRTAPTTPSAFQPTAKVFIGEAKTKAINWVAQWTSSAPIQHVPIDLQYGDLLVFDKSGNLRDPKPYSKIPAPRPLDDSKLSPEQLRLWKEARESELAGFGGSKTNDPLPKAVAFYEELLRSSPPAEFAALAHFHLGLLLERSGEWTRADAEFMLIRRNYPSPVTESGLPLDLLARAHMKSRDAFFLKDALEHPCAVTGDIIKYPGNSSFTQGPPAREYNYDTGRRSLVKQLDEAAALSIWNEQEQLRDIAELARTHFRTNVTESSDAFTNASSRTELPISSPPFFWVMTANEELGATNGARLDFTTDWLLTRRDNPNTLDLVVMSEQAVRDVVEQSLKRISRPKWLDFTVVVAGHPVIGINQLLELQYIQGGKGGGQFWHSTSPRGPLPLLATAGRREASEQFPSVSAILVSRDLLLAQQRERTGWFGLLIAVATGGAIVGFVSAYRAFYKQHRLVELKSNFVSSVSHELRAPLASIRLLAEGLERGRIEEPRKQHEYFGFIVQECRRLSSMIENVLNFSRIDQGRKKYEFELTDVAALVDQTVKLMEPYASERGVRLVPRIGEESADATGPNVSGEFIANLDGQSIQQALVNLLDNAIKHSPRGEIVLVMLRTSVAAAPNAFGAAIEPGVSPSAKLHLLVQDNGPGIPAHEHEKIFERFYRLGSELRRETQGVGIGLSIVKHIVDAHGGTVRVESEPGKGARFTIELPFKTAGFTLPRK